MFELVFSIEFENGIIVHSNSDRLLYDKNDIESTAKVLGYHLYNNDKFVVLYRERKDTKCIKIFKNIKGVKLK